MYQSYGVYGCDDDYNTDHDFVDHHDEGDEHYYYEVDDDNDHFDLDSLILGRHKV